MSNPLQMVLKTRNSGRLLSMLSLFVRYWRTPIDKCRDTKMKCPKCQYENPEVANFCVKCGAKLEIICPECDFSNEPSFKFCGKCGYKLSLPSEAPPRKDLSFDEKLEKIQKYLPKGVTKKILAQTENIGVASSFLTDLQTQMKT